MKGILFCLLGGAAAAALPAHSDGSPGATETAEVSRGLALESAEIPMPGESEAFSVESLVAPARFTVSHEIAPRLNSPHELTNNRSSFRVQYEKHFLDYLYLQFDSKLTVFWGEDHRARARGRDFLLESSSRDAHLQFSKADTSVRLGRQILVWGESDAGAVTDVISPRNLSELFFISLEESRTSQFMLNVEQFSRLGDVSAFYVPDAQFNEYPDLGTEYFLDPFQGRAVIEGGDADLAEYGARWTKTIGRSDIRLMAARLIDNDIALRSDGLASDGRLRFSKVRQRFTMSGVTFNQVMGSFMLSGELAWKSPLAFNTTEMQIATRDRFDTSLRLQYSWSATRSMSVEAVNRHVLGWTPELAFVPQDERSWVLGWNESLLNDDLTLNLLSVYTRPDTSLQHSLFISYRYNDSVTVGLDIFHLTVSDPRSDLYAYRKEDHAVLKLLYQF